MPNTEALRYCLENQNLSEAFGDFFIERFFIFPIPEGMVCVQISPLTPTMKRFSPLLWRRRPTCAHVLLAWAARAVLIAAFVHRYTFAKSIGANRYSRNRTSWVGTRTESPVQYGHTVNPYADRPDRSRYIGKGPHPFPVKALRFRQILS